MLVPTSSFTLSVTSLHRLMTDSVCVLHDHLHSKHHGLKFHFHAHYRTKIDLHFSPSDRAVGVLEVVDIPSTVIAGAAVEAVPSWWSNPWWFNLFGEGRHLRRRADVLPLQIGSHRAETNWMQKLIRCRWAVAVLFAQKSVYRQARTSGRLAENWFKACTECSLAVRNTCLPHGCSGADIYCYKLRPVCG